MQVGYGKDGGFDGGGRSRLIPCLDAYCGAHLYSCVGEVFVWSGAIGLADVHCAMRSL